MRRTKIFAVLVLLMGITILTYAALDTRTRFGGFYGPPGSSTIPPVSAFLNTVGSYGYTTGGPYAAYVSHFDTSNNSGVDNWHFSYVCASGSQWSILVHDGIVNLNAPDFGGSSNQGWGDKYLNWIAFYTGNFIATQGDWWSVWMSNNPYDVLDGCHIVLGFHTNVYIAPAVSVSSHYADYICTGGEILLKWFHAVWYYSYCQSTSLDKAAAVFSPGSQHDTLTSYSSDPPPTILYCWYY
jgi:hypothetical protein